MAQDRKLTGQQRSKHPPRILIALCSCPPKLCSDDGLDADIDIVGCAFGCASVNIGIGVSVVERIRARDGVWMVEGWVFLTCATEAMFKVVG